MSKAISILVLSVGFSVPCVPSPAAAARAHDVDGGLNNLAAHIISLTEGRRQTAVRRAPVWRRASPVRRRRLPQRTPDVIYYPTPPETVAEMLRLAKIKEGDVLYDLGSGDGRIPIMAAQKYGIRAVGIDINPELVAMSEDRARQAGVADRVQFRTADLFRADISEATIVTLYLSNALNLRLRPKLLRELRPGTRIISHDFRMGDWEPEQTVRVPWLNLSRTVYVWTVPAHGRLKRKR
ncbi:MAG: methyltransferase domain-containing protein [Acidobacteria bacterium]|nr:methyltransferase domain-containing protein [Acidobacteriota bacterium]